MLEPGKVGTEEVGQGIQADQQEVQMEVLGKWLRSLEG